MTTTEGPYVPGDHTVQEVLQHVEQNPDQREQVLADEQAGANRSTLVTQLEAKQGGDAEADPFEGPPAPEQQPAEGDETETEVGDWVDYGTERYEVKAIDDETGTLTLSQPTDADKPNPDVTASADEVTNVSKYETPDGTIVDLTAAPEAS